jgi:hypothetical protein
LSDVSGLLEQVPAVPDVEQVERVAAKNAKSALEKIPKMSGEDKAVWECERKEMQWQVNRLREEALAAENARHGLEEMCSRSRALLEEMCRRSRTLLEDMCRRTRQEDKTVWQREREEIQGQVHRLRAEVLAAANAKASLDEMSKTRQQDKAVWQRKREEKQRQAIRLREELRSATATQAETHGQTLQLQRTNGEDERAILEGVPLRMHNQASRAIVSFEMSSEALVNNCRARTPDVPNALDPHLENTSAADACLRIFLRQTHCTYRQTTAGRKRVKWTMCWRQQGQKARGLRADKKVECEKTRKNIWGLKR